MEPTKAMIKDWQKRLTEKLKVPIKVTGGAYRGYDVSLDFDKKTQKFIVDIYTPMRINPLREARAFAYIVELIKKQPEYRTLKTK